LAAATARNRSVVVTKVYFQAKQHFSSIKFRIAVRISAILNLNVRDASENKRSAFSPEK
jgi:hypothetical protein